MAQSSTLRNKEASKEDDSEPCLLLVPVVCSLHKNTTHSPALQSFEADLPNFAQDLTAVSSLSIRACSSLFYRFYVYHKGCVMVTFWGLVCRRYLARNLAGTKAIRPGFSWPFSVMLDEHWSRTSLEYNDFFPYLFQPSLISRCAVRRYIFLPVSPVK